MWYGLRVATAITPLVALGRPDAANVRAWLQLAQFRVTIFSTERLIQLVHLLLDDTDAPLLFRRAVVGLGSTLLHKFQRRAEAHSAVTPNKSGSVSAQPAVAPSSACDIIDMTSFSTVALLASASGLRLGDVSKAGAGRLREALQRIGRGSYPATFDTRDVGL